ncbi:MAG TPA: UDP-2,3-diacylglucosamine diphosphatase [Paludibacteraceae bacterium]|jgi:UDP-2,3-diacylglucosamine hydrolase|nr:UDP-2,3-diacylglucosamine diphosphatase [Paludibacteraceae bacterium]
MKYYFLADAHLGSLVIKDPEAHQQKLIDWLDMAKTDATEIFLLGDIFDFWFEFWKKVPTGYEPLLDKLTEITRSGISVHFFTGNHDLWTFGFLEKRIGLIVHKKPITVTLAGKRFYLAHGDGLGDKDFAFRCLCTIFHSKICQFLFRTLVPPKLGFKLGLAWSKSNRQKRAQTEIGYKGEEKESIVIFAKKHSATNPIDYYIMGHRHIVLNLLLANKSQLFIIGDFMEEFSYAVFDGETVNLLNFDEQ